MNKPENTPGAPWFARAVETLADPQELRVWSLIVSCFGDMARRPGDQISGVTLTELGATIGLRSEAVRVALHRLRKDGWIESLRDGRASFHRLSARGLQETRAASPGIYAPVQNLPQAWHIICCDEGRALPALKTPPQNYRQLSRSVAIGQGSAGAAPENMLSFDARPAQVPDWMQRRICPPELFDAAAALYTALGDSKEHLDRAPELPGPLQVAALRTLIVHRWRRVLLRMPPLPGAFFPEGWAGENCRARVAELLRRLPCPELADFEAAARLNRQHP